jgi:hypothetical protein
VGQTLTSYSNTAGDAGPKEAKSQLKAVRTPTSSRDPAKSKLPVRITVTSHVANVILERCRPDHQVQNLLPNVPGHHEP